MKWSNCKNILVIRPDNMGDVIMSVPAIRALKQTFGARITILTSSMAKNIIPHIPEIDEAIVFDLPWVKTASKPNAAVVNEVVKQLSHKRFDAAVIFTVFSQSPLPAAMLAYLAGIQNVLAYCRENPYHLITHWVPDKEPYDMIKHQVRRDLDLVRHIGAYTANEDLSLLVEEHLWPGIKNKLADIGFDTNKPWLILHAGVSEEKRKYPAEEWAKVAQKLIEQGYQVLLTGSASELKLTDQLNRMIGPGSLSAGGMFNLSEFICLIKQAMLVISVNTGTVHIAAAVKTPAVVLYAQTNPQHTPWNVPCKVLEFPVHETARSRNEVIAYLNATVYKAHTALPLANDIVKAVNDLFRPLQLSNQPFVRTPSQNQAIRAS